MLVWGSPQLDGVTIETQWDQRVARFGPGATVPLGNGEHVFDVIPESVNGRLYTKRNFTRSATAIRELPGFALIAINASRLRCMSGGTSTRATRQATGSGN